MEEYRILAVDDDESLRRIIDYNLKQRGYLSTSVESAEQALELLKKSAYNLLITDLKLPGLSGMELMQKAKAIYPDMPVICITAFGTIEKAVEAMKLGAFDYITKPFDRDDFLMTVEKALEFQRLKDENIRLRRELDGQYSFSNIIGVSRPMQEIFLTIKKVAATDATILITGESGTGKELVAKAIHRYSDRAANSMITVNCAAIPRDLLESELFGHIMGSFTGAIKNKTGKFILANNSTIFLDEIADLHPELQAKLLRVLQEKIVEPVGSNESISIDIRVIAATNQDLSSRVKNGLFREDLFYRLNVIPITIPPLRERRDDIPMLIDYFARRFSDDEAVSFDNRALDALTNYSWPGNVRELENFIKRIIILAKGKKIKITDLPDEILNQKPNGIISQNDNARSPSILVDSEIKMIAEALGACGWNQSKAAKRLGIPRHVLIYRMKKYGIKEI